ncbi:MAG: exodeoxyribonuclease small subunit [Clostridiales bacterium]|nr:exodeoxyribonuclease small subunit [Clostridiales bacterium]
MAKAKDLESSMQALEQVLMELEKEEISLEESFLLYQQGMKLIKTCNDSIDKVEKQLILLNQGEHGDEEK